MEKETNSPQFFINFPANTNEMIVCVMKSGTSQEEFAKLLSEEILHEAKSVDFVYNRIGRLEKQPTLGMRVYVVKDMQSQVLCEMTQV